MEIKTIGATATARPKITAAIRNNDRVDTDTDTDRDTVNKVNTVTISMFLQKIIPTIKADIQIFRGGNHKNDSTKWKNNTNDKIIPEFTENGNKLDQINTAKSSSRFARKGSNY